MEMIAPVFYVPNTWFLLSKAYPIETKLPQRPKKSINKSDSFKQLPKMSDPLLGQNIDIKI